MREGAAGVGEEDAGVEEGARRGGQARKRAEQPGSMRERSSLGRRPVRSETRWAGVDFVFLFRR